VKPGDILRNTFKERLARGEVVSSMTVRLVRGIEIARIAKTAGFDALYVDLEHSSLTLDATGQICMAGLEMGLPAFVRVPANTPEYISRMLDAGALGIVAPDVRSAEEARVVVAAAKYAPLGRRGRGCSRAHRYGQKIAEYSADANDATAVIVQAEHKDAVADIRNIVRVEGLDAVLIGPYDLASSMGHVGDVTHPDVVAAIETVRTACVDAGMALGYFGVSADAVTPYLAKGFTMIVVGIDVLLLGEAAKAQLSRVRGTASKL
jgi:4-hydroxy-2-oxoheptanedioate aldolase